MEQNLKKMKGITLIALVVTIVILIILAGVAINMTLGENGIFKKAQYAKEQYEMAAVKEKINLAILEIQTEEINRENLTLDRMLTKLQEKLPEIEIAKDGETLKGTLDGYDFTIDENFSITIDGYNEEAGNGGSQEPEVATYTVTVSGSNVICNGATQVNKNESYTATIIGTIKYYVSNIIVLMNEKTLEKGVDYTYENGQITIPTVTGNVEIAITTLISNKISDGSWNGEVNTPNLDNTGLIPVYYNDVTSEWIELSEDKSEEEWANWYDYGNKKWANAKSDDGSMWVWIPRYEYSIDKENQSIDVQFVETSKITPDIGYTYVHPAFLGIGYEDVGGGFGTDEKGISGFWVAKYEAGYQTGTASEVQKSIYKYTSISSDSKYQVNYYGNIEENSTLLAYPVFKPNVYSYNLISIGDAFVLSKEIATSSMYDLKNLDSHLIKNSEWGAVAYLTHSKYGLDANNTNNKEVIINSKNLADTTQNIHAVTSYGNNGKANDVTACSTQNMTGVFDISGGVNEFVAAYLKDGNADKSIWHSAMADVNTQSSTKYITLYEANNKYGDASSETTGWNSDYTNTVKLAQPVFLRGGYWGDNSVGGIYYFNIYAGAPSRLFGFRAVLCVK